MTKSTIASLLPVAIWLTAGPDAPTSEKEALTKTALNYAMGWYEGNAERMESALHPDLAKRRLMPDARTKKGKVEQMSALTLVQYTRNGGGTKVPTDKRRADVTILEVYGNTAQVKLVMQDWVDFMQMVKIGGEWKIINVLWEFTPEAKERYGIPSDL